MLYPFGAPRLFSKYGPEILNLNNSKKKNRQTQRATTTKTSLINKIYIDLG